MDEGLRLELRRVLIRGDEDDLEGFALSRQLLVRLDVVARA